MSVLTRASQPHSELTKDRQLKLRYKLMHTASVLAGQMHADITEGAAYYPDGREIVWNRARLAMMKSILDRTIPPLLAVQLDLNDTSTPMSPNEVISQLADFLIARPELRDQLLSRLGMREAKEERGALTPVAADAEPDA